MLSTGPPQSVLSILSAHPDFRILINFQDQNRKVGRIGCSRSN